MNEQPQLEVHELPTDALVPYANNAKIHSALQVEQIANSIQEFGFNDPIAVWENKEGKPEIVEGHGRVLAAKKLGIDKLPVIYLNHLSDDERRAYTHIHNQTTLNSGFDFAVLEDDLDSLEYDWEDFGFDIDSQDDSLESELSDAYSDNIGVVDYEPKNTAHKVSELYSEPKESDLEEKIAKVASKELREMLELRKAWFTDFKYAKIADYYAYQATPEEQRAFEALGLVLLDRDGMIQNGFADLVGEL